MQICMYVHKGECKSRTTTEQAAGGARGNEMKGGTQQRRFEFRHFGWDVSKLQQARKNTSPAMND